MRHWFEDDHAINKKNIDSEGAPATPKPDLDAKLFEEPTAMDSDLEEFPDDLFDDLPAHDFGPTPETPTAQPQPAAMDASESAVADIFGDFDDAMDDAETSMI